MTRHKNRYVLHEMRLCQEKQESPLGLRGLSCFRPYKSQVFSKAEASFL